MTDLRAEIRTRQLPKYEAGVLTIWPQLQVTVPGSTRRTNSELNEVAKVVSKQSVTYL
jgi:hypothetical protein